MRKEQEKRTCEFCGRLYEVNPCSKDHQKYCSDKRCVKMRKRERQREWNRKKRQEDRAWKIESDKRSADSHRKKSKRDKLIEEARMKAEFEEKTSKVKKEAFRMGLLMLVVKPKTFEELAGTINKLEKIGQEISSSGILREIQSTCHFESENSKINRHAIPKNLLINIKDL